MINNALFHLALPLGKTHNVKSNCVSSGGTKTQFKSQRTNMKRLGNVFEKIYDIENLRKAHYNARKGKAHYKEVQMVNQNEDYYLKKLQLMLKEKSYKTSEYVLYNVNDKGKVREISKLPYFPDRICHWAIMLQIEDMFRKNFIYDTYASIPQKGTHVLIDKLKKTIQNKDETCYCLKLDIKKFFPNINHEILKNMLRLKIKDKDLLWLLDEIVDSAKSGLPIGNYLSQYLSNFYLSYFDHWLKEKMKIRHYFRYMDDIIILHSSKTYLHGLLKSQIIPYLNNNLKLTVKENWQIFPTFVRGIDFLGYRVFENYVLLRKKVSKNIKKKVKSIEKNGVKSNDINSIMSYMGWIKHCNGHNFFKKHLEQVIRRIKKYEKVVKQKQAKQCMG